MHNNLQRDQLRAHLRKLRASLSTAQVNTYSASICAKANTLIHKTQARHIAAYYALGNEVDLTTCMLNVEKKNWTGYVPIVLPQFQMQFAPVNSSTQTSLNKFGIREPNVELASLVEATALDTVLVPLVGFDEDCNRMGMGGGYYDRCFAHRKNGSKKPLLIGVAFECQGVANVHTESWDVPLDYVITEKRIIQRKNNS